MDEIPKIKPTKLIWLVPITMGLLGGILMYIAVKDEDPQKANDGILASVLSTIAILFLAILYGISISSQMPMIPFN